MPIQLKQIAELTGGELSGDPEIRLTGANPPGEAIAGEITMVDDLRHLDSLGPIAASAMVVNQKADLDCAQLVVADPHLAFAKVVSLFRPPCDLGLPAQGIDDSAEVSDDAEIHPTAIVGSDVRIGRRTRLMPGVVVMPGCRLGADCTVHAGVTLYPYTELLDRVVIHAGSVIGAHGFGYRLQDGRHVPTAQLGYVLIESDVEIGASVTIDRGTYGSTRIGEGTKIDNQVMIAHNCQIGKHNLLCSQVGIAGSCRTGDYVVLAGQVGLKDHISLGDHTIVGAQAGVMDDCRGGEVYLGSPATTQREQMQIMAVERRLPEMRREIKQLRRQLEQLQSELSAGQPTAERRAA